MHMSEQLPRAKPRLRGVSHQFAAMVALGAGAVLVAAAPTARATLAALVYGASLVCLFSVSGLYHRRHWSPVARQHMRRLDHASIFLVIAGSYTPFCLLPLYDHGGLTLLALVWIGAAVGIVKTIFWVHAPKPLTALIYVVLGGFVLTYLHEVRAVLSLQQLTLLWLGGIFYTVGAVIYALKRPDPFPAVFGYHEIFHVLVILASICHFGAIFELVLRGVAA